ncbi:formyltransferase family protein [Pseudomonas chlororaphis]|uniref:formyltransferase family protein n=1 Tax=Pseudomonas chlororaphis TaxID=587753 RepID=UPI000B15C09C|nr:formyltransferase family protein [Pseudomonas chlororaphis]
MREISLEAAYEVASTAFISLEFDRIVVPGRFSISRVSNIHFSRLPEYKGMFTSVWPLLESRAEAGVTLHFIDRGIDTGEIVAQQVFPRQSAATECSGIQLLFKGRHRLWGVEDRSAVDGLGATQPDQGVRLS